MMSLFLYFVLVIVRFINAGVLDAAIINDIDDQDVRERRQNQAKTDYYIIPSKNKQTWEMANDRCKQAGLSLAVIQTPEENEFLLNDEMLKDKRYYAPDDKFWTGGKVSGNDVTSWAITWHPSGKKGSGVNFKWDGSPMGQTGKGIICVAASFPDNETSHWSVNDCLENYYYICMREPKESVTSTPLALNTNHLSDNDVAISKGKLSWHDAFENCQKSGLVLASVENQEDNDFLSNNKKLHSKPYDQETRFWTSGKMKGARFESALLFWESTRKLFPNHMAANANGVNKLWDKPPNPKPNKGIMCLDINFPNNDASRWTISDCNEKRYYICMREMQERMNPSGRSKTAQISDDDDGAGYNNEDPAPEPDSSESFYRKVKKPKPNPEPSTTTGKEATYVPGTFIPDVTPKKLIRGKMRQGKPAVFKPDDDAKSIKGFTPGTFIPDESTMSKWPYSVLHGNMKPYMAEPGSSIFVPNSFATGDFKPDSESVIYLGSMTQDDPSIFTPDSAPYISKPLQGTWKPHAGALPNHPCRTVHGTMEPVDGSETEAKFTPDALQIGFFIPDASLKQIRGSLSPTNPPEFIAAVKSHLPQKPTSGTWRPKAGDPHSPSHGIMKLSPAGNSNLYLPDEVTMGHFVPQQSSINPIEGYMTVSIPQVFSTPDETADLSKPIRGSWKPAPGQRGTGNPKGLRGILKPDLAILPLFSAFFNTGSDPEAQAQPNENFEENPPVDNGELGQ